MFSLYNIPPRCELLVVHAHNEDQVLLPAVSNHVWRTQKSQTNSSRHMSRASIFAYDKESSHYVQKQ